MELQPHELNLRHLRAFAEVCRSGSFSQAAAITNAIASLERQLRTALFTRGARGVTGTDAANTFLFRINRALNTLNQNLPRTKTPLPVLMKTGRPPPSCVRSSPSKTGAAAPQPRA